MTQNINTNNSTLVNSICAIVFILFTYVYLYFFQADLLAMEQHVLSGGTTHYNKTIGAVLITLVMYLLKLGVSKLTKFDGWLHILNYVPSLLLIIILTSGDQNFDTNAFPAWVVIVVSIVFVVYIVLAVLYRFKYFLQINTSFTGSILGGLWKSLLAMSVMFLIVCALGNTNEVFHYRLRTEWLLNTNDYEKALHVGEKSDDTDANLTMLRVYALSRTKQLGERLFEYPIPHGGSDLLLPDGVSIKCLLYPESEIFKQLGIRKKGRMRPLEYLLYLESHGLAMKSVTDYILCGYLLDKNLDAFVNTIKTKYNLTSPSLPKHYKEALILYTHLRANPVLVFHSEIMDADYSDFQKLEEKYIDKAERYSYVKDTYGETYWFYYFYQ
ncbi:DUF6057 family protein [uncultured Prevotella sp.]|uniref:DUF6057 family protein n=1 Tax=uncultured Prevotella sp. TaxID=159272 RepID=UPI002609B7D5|nr:DUF6057 family protein [uncultured Prevotella sp.]